MIRHLICGKKVKLAFELESDLQDTVGYGRKWILHFNGGKTHFALFVQSNIAGAIMLK